MEPLFYAFLAAAAGVAAGVRPWLAPWWFWAIAAAALAAWKDPRLVKTGVLALCFLAGARLAWRQTVHPRPPDSLVRATDTLQQGPRQRVILGGYLRDDAQPGNGFAHFDLEAEFLESGSRLRSVSGGARLYLRNADVAVLGRLRAGQAVAVATHLRPPTRYLDPGVADFSRRLRREGIDLEGDAEPQDMKFLPEVRGGLLPRWRAAVWSRLSVAIDRLAPPSGQAALNGTLRGMLLGDTARLAAATRTDFQIDGIYHVLVVAGLHIGVLALFCLALLRWLRCPPLAASGICLALLAAYAWVISGRTPTLRVLFMLAVYFLARAWYRERQPLNAVGAAGLALLLWHPLDLFAPGFQMSFGAATLLAGVVVPTLGRTSRPLIRCTRRLEDVGFDEAFSPRLTEFRLTLRALATRLGWFWRPLGWRLLPWALRGGLEIYELLVVAFVLQLGLAAFMVVYFHRATPWAPLINAAIVPMVCLLLPLAWALAAGQTLLGALPAAATDLLHGLGNLMLRCAHAAARWPFAAHRSPSPPGWALTVFAGAIAFWLFAARRGGIRFRVGTYAVAALAALLAWAPLPPRLPRGALTVTVLDVGQGDAIFVAFPHGRTLLVDGGPRSASGFDAGEEVVAPYLWSLGLRHIDAVLLTHAHMDHIGGLPFVMANFHPQELWVTETLPPEAVVTGLLRAAIAQGTRIVRCREGERFRIGGTELDVLLPAAGYRAGLEASNDDSMVVRLIDGRMSALLEGDAQAAGERAMLASGLPLASTLLKVGHHGSRTSSTPAFLAAVDPAAAVISDGVGNIYGFPRPITLDRLAAVGARIFRTDEGGAVEVRFAGGAMRIYRYVPKA